MLFMQKDLGCLKPGSEQAASALNKIKLGDLVLVEMKRPRNLHHHRKFWALAHEVANNQEHYPDAEAVVAAIKVATGHCTWVQTPKGMVGIPKSIAFHKMDQTQFEEFYDKAVGFICETIIPGLDSNALRQRIEEIL